MADWYVCARCGNQNQRSFKTIPKGTYCTACIAFGRCFVGESLASKEWPSLTMFYGDFQLPFALTKLQKECSEQILRHVKDNQDVLLHACCGAGKTEMIFPLITYCLRAGKRIGLAIPRRDVVAELEKRVRKAFPKTSVCAVYGDHHDVLEASVILCTTHQLYRYAGSFDVLILDEVDAFPYKGNKLLEHIAHQACKGTFVYMTATPDHVLKQKVKQGLVWEVTLFQRPHGHPLCIPKVQYGFSWVLAISLLCFLQRHHKKVVLLFVPTIRKAKRIAYILSQMRSICLFTSQSERREELLAEIKAKQYQVVVCTTVLERGITIEDVQVAIWDASHSVFDEATLIQIVGRIGRSPMAFEGEGLLLCLRKSKCVKQCINSLKKMNAASIAESC